ncbi:MFS transporter [Owariibacterium komagatae]|uniref:MFS transporter n=1 Tax=Owariibacterium komagatae TaxID=3136601 RepID=UPI0038B274E2
MPALSVLKARYFEGYVQYSAKLRGVSSTTQNNIWKPFNAKFLQRLGGSDLMVFLLTALPGLVAVLTLIPSSLFLARSRSKKRVMKALFYTNRGLLLVIAVIPFLPESIRPLIFVLLVGFINFPDGASQNAMQGYVGELFEERERVEALSLRIKFSTFFTPFVTMLTGALLAHFENSGNEILRVYQIIFVVAFLLGMVEISVFSRFRDREMPADQNKEGGAEFCADTIKQIFKNRKFVKYIILLFVFNFFWQSGGPLSSLYMLNVLHANELWIAFFSIISGIVALFTAPFWNKLIFRIGNNRSLILLSLVMVFNLGLYLLAKDCYAMCAIQLVNGLALMGSGVVIINGVYEVAPRDNNGLVYIGVYNTLYNISMFVAPFFSYWILSHWNLTTAIVIVSLGRAFCFVLFLLTLGGEKKLIPGKAPY